MLKLTDPPRPVVSDRESALAAALPLVGVPMAGPESRLPTFSTDLLAPLASLSSCYINLERGCDFHRDERSRQYLHAWRQPAPTWCASNGSSGPHRGSRGAPPQPVLRDRLGIPVSVYRKR